MWYETSQRSKEAFRNWCNCNYSTGSNRGMEKGLKAPTPYPKSHRAYASDPYPDLSISPCRTHQINLAHLRSQVSSILSRWLCLYNDWIILVKVVFDSINYGALTKYLYIPWTWVFNFIQKKNSSKRDVTILQIFKTDVPTALPQFKVLCFHLMM